MRWFMQRLADILGQRVEVALNPETTALGAAYHAGQAAGFYGDAEELEKAWAPARVFEPRMSETEREARYGGWLEAVARVRSHGAVSAVGAGLTTPSDCWHATAVSAVNPIEIDVLARFRLALAAWRLQICVHRLSRRTA